MVIDEPESQALPVAVQNEPEELALSKKRFKRQQEGLTQAQGAAATVGAQAIMGAGFAALIAEIKASLSKPPADAKLRKLAEKLRRVDLEKLALSVLDGAVQGVFNKDNLRATAERIGNNLRMECLGAGLFKHYQKITPTQRALKKLQRFEKALLSQPAQVASKQARAAALQEGYNFPDWSRKNLVHAGEWGTDLLLGALPKLFELVDRARKHKSSKKRRTEKHLKYTEEAKQYAQELIAEILRRKPTWLPMTIAPLSWTNWDKGVTSDHRLAAGVRFVSGRDVPEVKKAFKRGTIKPTVDAVNALQAVPFSINKRVLGVLKECAFRKIVVEGMPKDDDAGDLTAFEAIIQTAEKLAESERFWTPMHVDWRGRVYPSPSFNFQREDRVRALFLFADGEPVGKEGIYWLKVHAANCGDFGAVSKRPFLDRIQWVDDNQDLIDATATKPIEDHRWTKADKPFLFLAACIELHHAANDPTYESRLPVSFDGSCSGLQHMCAMTRSREGALVNLTPGDPQDVYQEVAERLKDRIEHDRSNATKRLFAEKCLAWIWDENAPARPRKTVKTNVMTYFYGSNVSGMTDQQLDGPLEKLEMEERELEELADTLRLPLSFAQARMKIAKYIAQHVHATIEEVVKEPAKVKKLLGKLARSLGDEGIPLRWTSPSGFPWVNRYQEPVVEQIRLIFRSIGIRTRVSAATGEHKPGIDVRRAGQGAPPNFVHACDAAHLMLTVNAAVAEGITSIATVHDSFGCLASRATRFRQIIREEFLRMYKEHDVLAEILEQASADLTDTTKLPRLPEKGKLDIEGVLEAEYAFA